MTTKVTHKSFITLDLSSKHQLILIHSLQRVRPNNKGPMFIKIKTFLIMCKVRDQRQVSIQFSNQEYTQVECLNLSINNLENWMKPKG